MARLRYNGLTATLGGALTSSGTTVTFGAPLTHSGGTAVPTITGSDYIPLTILDTTGAVSEIVSLTAYTSGATTGTITRAQESTTGVAHASGDAVVHSPTIADFDSSGGSAGRVLLDTQNLAAAAASITFGSGVVPTSGYSSLEIELIGRTSQAAATTGIGIQLNGDTTAGNYASQRLLSEASTASAVTTTGTQIGYVAGDSATAGVAGSAKILVPDFLGTAWRKTVRAESFTPGDFCLWGLSWANTAAITQVAIVPNSGNFKIGTVARLYGLA